MAAGPFVTEFDSIALTSPKEFDEKFKAKMNAFPKNMGFAVVDLTTGLPVFSGTELQKEKHVYSLAKICGLLAATRLSEARRHDDGSVTRILALHLRAETRRLVFGIVELGEAIGELAAREEELESIGEERIRIVGA